MEKARKVKIITVVGARPNFMKAAPILAAIRDHNDCLAASSDSAATVGSRSEIQSLLLHTGQHYDEAMSDWFFADLNIPKPNMHLGVGSGSHATQTAEIMKRFEEVLLRERPHVVIVVGDVNSTLACALVAAKVSCDGHGPKPLIAHVEAGLRSFDRCMPEEINRILTDHLADLLFVTEESGLSNLRQEGIPDHKIHFVGNTMIDSLLASRQKASASPILDDLGLRNGKSNHLTTKGALPFALLTLHRPSNVDEPQSFLNILNGLEDLVQFCPVIFPAHPRTQRRIADFGFEQFFHQQDRAAGKGSDTVSTTGRITLIDPLGYLDFLCLMDHAAVVVTDSGGIQEETTSLGVPCVTVRDTTERPITVQVGSNVLAGTSEEGIRRAVKQQLKSKTTGTVPQAWDGRSAQRILTVICGEIEKQLF